MVQVTLVPPVLESERITKQSGNGISSLNPRPTARSIQIDISRRQKITIVATFEKQEW